MRIAVAQMRSGIDPAANATAIAALIDEAGARGADMLFTPEMSGLLDRDRKRASANIGTQAEDPTLAAACEGAARAGIWVQLGSLALRPEPAAERYVNRSFLIDAAGTIRARYDKIHLFDVDLPSGESWRESAAYAAGREAVAADTPWGRLGLSVCYDLRFPDLYRALSDAGATMIAIPAAFTVPTGEAHWHILQRARAIEAGAFVIAAAQAGQHEDGRMTYGHSLVVDPWGTVLLDMGADCEAPLAIVDIDPGAVEEVRGRIPTIAHRRPIGEVAIAR